MEPELLASIAAALIAFGVVSRKMERGIVSPPMVFVLLGLALGRVGWLGVERAFIDGLAELTLALLLFTDAARIDLTCLRREESLPARLLGIGLPLTIAAGAVAASMVFPTLGF